MKSSYCNQGKMYEENMKFFPTFDWFPFEFSVSFLFDIWTKNDRLFFFVQFYINIHTAFIFLDTIFKNKQMQLGEYFKDLPTPIIAILLKIYKTLYYILKEPGDNFRLFLRQITLNAAADNIRLFLLQVNELSLMGRKNILLLCSFQKSSLENLIH